MRHITRSVRVFAASAGLAIAASACGGDGGSNEPQATEIEGSWSGPLEVDAGTATVTFTLTEDGGDVTGSGSISGGSGSLPITVSGTYSEPNLSLTFSSEGFEPVDFSASVDGTTMTGTLNGSGFDNVQITLNRQ